MQGSDWKEIYRFSIRLGLKTIGINTIIPGLQRILCPIEYWRAIEYTYLLKHLDITRDNKVLDIGSPKLLSLFLAHRVGCNVFATDILDCFIASYSVYACKLNGNLLDNTYFLETQDGRELSYPDGTFDRVYSISVIEHIPDDGDTRTIKEIARVLKTGGKACITVPYCHREYYETWIDKDVYERTLKGKEKLFYQRHYDSQALEERLLAPSDMNIENIEYYGERGFRFEKFWQTVPIVVRMPLMYIEPIFSELFVDKIDPHNLSQAMTACITLRKKWKDHCQHNH